MNDDLAKLKQQMEGTVILPGDAAYEAKRNVFNAVGRPAVIVACASPSDVAKTLQFADGHKLELSVRSGGHGATGAATNNDGLVLDLSPMNEVTIVDAEQRIVRVGAGATWGNLIDVLEPYKLAIPAGDTRQVGVGGLTLGGGFGWLIRTYGLTVDALLRIEVVVADGTVLTASATENPDLFWAIRGGGGDFGVVVAFEFVAQHLPGVFGGKLTFSITEAKKVLTNLALYMRTAPDELNVTVDISPEALTLGVCYAGDQKSAADQAITPLMELGDVMSSDISKKRYGDLLVDARNKPPELKLLHSSGFVRHFDKTIAQQIVEHFSKNDLPRLEIRFLGGAYSQVDGNETAVAYREHEALVIVTDLAPPGTSEADARKKAASSWETLAAYTEGAYRNFMTFLDESKVYPPATLVQLRDVRTKYGQINKVTTKGE